MNKEKYEKPRPCTVTVFLTSVLAGTALTLLLFFTGASVICFTPVSSGIIELFVLIATIAGIFFSGFIAACKKNSKGWLWGGISGSIYVLILFAVSAFHGNSGILKLLISVPPAFICGSTGGILGINLLHS